MSIIQDTEITSHMAYMAETSLGSFEFRYNMSLTINVFFNGTEIDVMTLSERSVEAARDAVEEYLEFIALENQF